MPRFLIGDSLRSLSASGLLDAFSVGIPPGKRLIRGRTNRAGEPRPRAVAGAVSGSWPSAGFG
jgi:hypothetical protein